jgi:hypothetical protein
MAGSLYDPIRLTMAADQGDLYSSYGAQLKTVDAEP